MVTSILRQLLPVLRGGYLHCLNAASKLRTLVLLMEVPLMEKSFFFKKRTSSEPNCLTHRFRESTLSPELFCRNINSS